MPTLDFKGKQHIYAHHLTVPHRPLVPHKDKSIVAPVHISAVNAAPTAPQPDENDSADGDVCINNTNTPPHIAYSAVNTTPAPNAPDDNLIIHGDNLHALKALIPRYASRVHCIYIDPPYNTGNEGWAYNDRVNSPLMREWLKANGPVDGEDLERHDKWLCMMWPRLHLLRELLADNGVIFVSIDDNEQHHLRMLMDEIFGEENFVETFVWKKKGGAGNTEKLVGDIVENVIMYSRDKSQMSTNRRIIQSATYSHRDAGGAFRLQGLIKTDEGMYRRDTMKFGIPVPDTNDMAYPPEGQRWTSGYANMMNMLQADLLNFEKSDENWIVRYKDYFDENDPQTGVYLNLLLENGSLRTAKNELTRLQFGREDFDTPKPTPLITHLLRIATNPGDIILDSFAGSGTTAHAVLALNNEDGGNRKFILIECEDYADSITAERVRRVINGVPGARDQALQNGLGGSFTYYTLGKPIDIERMLTGDRLPAYPALAAYLLHTASGASAGDAELVSQNDDGLFYSDDSAAYHLLYEPDLARLCAPALMLNETRAKRVSAAARKQGKRAIVFGPGKYISQRELTRMGVTFCQLPYEMNRHGGG